MGAILSLLDFTTSGFVCGGFAIAGLTVTVLAITGLGAGLLGFTVTFDVGRIGVGLIGGRATFLGAAAL
jgi:hypothetical protein